MSRQTNKSKVKPVTLQPVAEVVDVPAVEETTTAVDIADPIVEETIVVEEVIAPTPEVVTAAEPAPPVDTASPELPKEPTSVREYFTQRYPNMLDLPNGVTAVIDTMEAYNHAMHPSRPIEPRAAVQFQRALHYCFLNALGLPGRQSQMALDAILWYFNKGRDGAFSQYLIFRPLPARSMSPSEISSLRMLLHLFYNTSDPATRKANLRSMVDIRKIVETLPTPKARESLLNFYA